MQQLYFTLCLLLFAGMGFAQDTVRVQTFTWADNSRSKTFQFPDNSDDTYEQILMRYNMRCHDAAIRTDNRGGFFGCGEWDYSCNTFIYDPSRLDSVKATHPSHLISGFDGDVFYYRNTAPYAYTEYTQYETELTYTGDPSLIEVPGSASAIDEDLYPLRPMRRQYLYRAEELVAAGLSAGPISALELNLTEGSGNFPFLRLRLQEVDLDSLREDRAILDGFTTVYFRNTALTAENDWHTFPFIEDFEWDGSSDLLLDVTLPAAPEGGNVAHTQVRTDYPSVAATVPPDDEYYLALNGDGWMELDFGEESPPLEQITLAFWTRGLDAAVGRNTSVMEAVDGSGQRQLNVHLPWGNNRIYWDCGNDGSGYDRIDKAADPAELAGKWNFWAFTKDATTGEMAIYLNGELWHSGTDKFRTIQLERLVFGANANYGNRWPGGIDHISVWRRALSGEDLKDIMFQQSLSGPDLALHYDLNEGAGLGAESRNPGYTARLFGPNWQALNPVDMRNGWYTAPWRWHVRFAQGEAVRNNQVFTVRDSQLVAPVTVRSFAIDASNNLQETGEAEIYPSDTYVYDENGNAIALIPLDEDGTIDIETLDYHRKQPAKFEILSLVTPYGIRLNLGPEGKTFTFDVTDYAPILRGEKRLSLELGGQNQEEMDIEFLFIKGTPPREVKDIANVWPFARGWYDPIQDDAIFEPRTLRLDPDAEAYKLRAAVTGHGQNGEFTPRQHYLNLDGGTQDFRFDVWKSCGQNPIYPQGGTWIFDRAGWCPGMATDVHEFFLPADVGAEVEVDYGVNGSSLTEANYLVSTQLVTYGPRNFALDAKIVDIIRPSTSVEYERINPICDDPVIRVRNTGATPITSLRIAYGLTGREAATYEWSGNLAPDEEAEIVLPVDNYSFWTIAEQPVRFQAEILLVNESLDEYMPNNTLQSEYVPTEVYDYEFPIVFQFMTNNRPAENRYTITNSAGEVVMERGNLSANTRYREIIDLPAGCYRLTFVDSGGDGLDFWYWAAIGQSRGTGNLSMRLQVRENLLTIVENFNPDFGGDLYYDFVIPGLVDTEEEIAQARRFSVFPNPARDRAVLELTGFAGETIDWSLHNLQGVIVTEGQQAVFGDTQELPISLTNLPAGLYLAKVRAGDRWYSREVVVLP